MHAVLFDSGVKAPHFELLDHNGNTVRLADLLGSWVVLWWFPKASTGG
jgi:peroxiredoxin